MRSLLCSSVSRQLQTSRRWENVGTVCLRSFSSQEGGEAQSKSSDLLQSIFGSQSKELKGGKGVASDEAQRMRDVDAIFESLFGKSRQKTDLEALKFFRLYPRAVRKWVSDAKTPPGKFNREGQWVEVPSTVYQHEEKSITRDAVIGLPFRRELPPDLAGKYRFGVAPAELADAPEKVKEVLSFKWASQREINTFRAAEAAKKFERSPMDTGSSEVQVARMTVRIRALTEHMSAHHKDKRTKRALISLVSQRSAMMKYLKRQDVEKYYKVLTTLNLRDIS